MGMRRTAAWFAPVFFLLSIHAAVAQGPTSRPVSELDRLVGHGDPAAALARACDDLAARLDHQPAGDDEIATEILLLRAGALAAYDPARLVSVLEAAHVEGWLEARATTQRQAALALVGRFQDARDEARRIGFVDQFLIAGPFDNERGGGFEPALPPEAGPVVPGARFPGKDREVGWRAFDAPTPTGICDVADALTPREQCLAYLACVIQAEHAGRLALGLGSSAATKVWLNGVLLFSGDFRREVVQDQERFPIDLAAGPNVLLIKAAVTQGPCEVAVRVAELDGGAPPNWVAVRTDVNAFPPEYPAVASRPASRAESRTAEAPAGFGGGLLRLKARAEAPTATVADLISWARLALLLRLDDQAHPRTQRFTARALALEPENAVARELHALALRRRIIVAAEKEDNERMAALEAARVADPRRVPVLQELVRTYLEDLRQLPVAEKLLAEALAVNPSAPGLLLLQAQLAEQRGQSALAETARRRAAEVGGAREAAALADSLARSGRHVEAQVVLDAALKKAAGDPGLLQALSRQYGAAGASENALRVARTELLRDPTNADVRLSIAWWLEALGDLAGARAELDALLAINPDHVEARRRAALLCDRLGERDRALIHLARALKIEPGNARLRRLEGWMSGHEKAFEDAWPVDAEAVVKVAPDAHVNPDNRPYRTLLRRVIIRVNPDGTAGRYVHTIAQVLNQSGADAFDVVNARHDQSDERVRFKVARLFRGQAAPVEAERLAGYAADFPALQPGDIVEWGYRVDDLRQSYFGNYFGLIHEFQEGDLEEVVRSELVLLLPKSREFHFHLRNTMVEAEKLDAPAFLPDYVARRYVLTDLKAVTREVAMPDYSEFLPQLQISTYGTWDDFAVWWWNLIREQYDVNDAMRTQVSRLLAGKTTRDEKIRAIYDFVVTDVRYVAWEFGVHGYKPYRTSAIFDRRFGDCKDKALLMSAMLREAGITAYPVLIRLDDARADEDHTLPLVEHFNHCIAAVPGEDGRGLQFLDGTAEYHSATDIPDGDRGARVVVVRDGKAEPAQVPLAVPADNARAETIVATLATDGALDVAFSAEAKGHYAVEVRATYINEADRREQLTAGVNRRYGQGVLSEVDFSKLGDLEAPVRMSYRFKVADSLSRDGGRARLKPLWPSFDWTHITVTETRRFDIITGTPGQTVTTCTVKLPPKWKVSDAPPDVVLDQPFAHYELKREIGDGQVVFHRVILLKEPRIKAADYAAFKLFASQVVAADLETVTVEEVR